MRRTLGVKFSRHVLAKLHQYKGSLLPHFLISCPQIWQVHKMITEDINGREKSEILLQLFFMVNSIKAVLYAAVGNFLQMPAENE